MELFFVYFGLIVVLGAYAYKFILELIELMKKINVLTDTEIMLGALDLIDVVMIANLLIMVIIGGSTFGMICFHTLSGEMNLIIRNEEE